MSFSRSWFTLAVIRRSLPALLLSLFVGVGSAASAQTFGKYTDFYDFKPTTLGTNGQQVPNSGGEYFVFDKQGNMFGIVPQGNGAYESGLLFELTANGVYKDLHDFGGPILDSTGKPITDGYEPGPITIDSQGNIFGAADEVLWEFTKEGVYKDVHDFHRGIIDSSGQAAPDGGTSFGSFLFDSNGNLYGTCYDGGTRYDGLIWKLSPSGVYQDIHDFGTPLQSPDGSERNDGIDPSGYMTMDSSGNLFGVANGGGVENTQGGVVWECSQGGTFRDLHFFGGTVKFTTGAVGPEGILPGGNVKGGVTIDSSGNLYGITEYGGPYPLDPQFPEDGGCGIVWKLTPDGTYSDIHDFGGTYTDTTGASKSDGAGGGALIADYKGDLYGLSASSQDSVSEPSRAFIFELSSGGQYIDLHDFEGTITYTNGQTGKDPDPSSGITIDPNGNFVGGAYPVTWRLSATTKLKQFTISPSSLIGGNSATGTITLANSVPTADIEVGVSSASSAAQPSASVTIPAGQTTVTFSIPTAAVAATTSPLLTAKISENSLTASMTVQAPTIKAFSVTPSSVVGGSTSIGTVTLSGTAPAGGIAVSLSSGSANVSVPATVTVPPKGSSATFTIKTTPVAGDTSVKITAATGAASISSSVVVRAPAVASISLSPTSVIGGSASSGVVTIGSAAPAGGLTVTLSANSSSAIPPVSVLIPAGGTQATFTVATLAVATSITTTVEAQFGSSNRATGLLIRCPTITGVALSPSSLVGGASSIGKVSLGSVAPSGGLTINLASSSTNAQTPATVIVPAGSSTVTFTVSTNAVSSPVVANISAKTSSSSAASSLSIKAPTVTGLSLTPTSVSGSSTVSVVGTVTISSAAPGAGLVVSLSSSDPSALKAPASVKVPAGATSVTFSLVKSPVSEKVTVTITAIANGVSRSAAETVTP